MTLLLTYWTMNWNVVLWAACSSMVLVSLTVACRRHDSLAVLLHIRPCCLFMIRFFPQKDICHWVTALSVLTFFWWVYMTSFWWFVCLFFQNSADVRKVPVTPCMIPMQIRYILSWQQLLLIPLLSLPCTCLIYLVLGFVRLFNRARSSHD